ncbi:MAG: DUF4266 domain-containing protein [Gammaproteobacteria bacterium]|nr:DUF4266 domain-containing protein [Gammaproteobacteria bacterium]
MHTLPLITITASLALLVSGCTLEEVKPWQRNLLAKESMQLIADPSEQLLNQHLYFSKEAASGGEGVGGGGCGCN